MSRRTHTGWLVPIGTIGWGFGFLILFLTWVLQPLFIVALVGVVLLIVWVVVSVIFEMVRYPLLTPEAREAEDRKLEIDRLRRWAKYLEGLPRRRDVYGVLGSDPVLMPPEVSDLAAQREYEEVLDKLRALGVDDFEPQPAMNEEEYRRRPSIRWPSNVRPLPDRKHRL